MFLKRSSSVYACVFETLYEPKIVRPNSATNHSQRLPLAFLLCTLYKCYHLGKTADPVQCFSHKFPANCKPVKDYICYFLINVCVVVDLPSISASSRTAQRQTHKASAILYRRGLPFSGLAPPPPKCSSSIPYCTIEQTYKRQQQNSQGLKKIKK